MGGKVPTPSHRQRWTHAILKSLMSPDHAFLSYFD